MFSRIKESISGLLHDIDRIPKSVSDMPDDANPVVQPWVFGLTWKMQTVLFTAIRGCDGKTKEDPSKQVSRAIRSMILNCADPKNPKFMKAKKGITEVVFDVTEDIDHYPIHWVMHVCHAIEIIGYKYPHPIVGAHWKKAYNLIVDSLHLCGETEEQLDNRLADGKTSPVRKVSPPIETQDRGYYG